MNLGTEVTHGRHIRPIQIGSRGYIDSSNLEPMRNLISSFVGVNQCFLCDILCSLRYLTNGKLLFAILVPDSLIIYNNIICLPSLYHPLVLPFHTLSTWIGDHDPTSRQFSPSVPLLCHALLCMHEYITGVHVIYIITPHSGKFSNGASFV